MTKNAWKIVSACEQNPTPENQERVRHLVNALTGEIKRFKRENGNAYKFIASTGLKVKRPMLLSALYTMWSKLNPEWEMPALPKLKR